MKQLGIFAGNEPILLPVFLRPRVSGDQTRTYTNRPLAKHDHLDQSLLTLSVTLSQRTLHTHFKISVTILPGMRQERSPR